MHDLVTGMFHGHKIYPVLSNIFRFGPQDAERIADICNLPEGSSGRSLNDMGIRI